MWDFMTEEAKERSPEKEAPSLFERPTRDQRMRQSRGCREVKPLRQIRPRHPRQALQTVPHGCLIEPADVLQFVHVDGHGGRQRVGLHEEANHKGPGEEPRLRGVVLQAASWRDKHKEAHKTLSQYRCMRQQITSFDVLKISGGEAWLTRTAISRSPLWMLCR